MNYEKKYEIIKWTFDYVPDKEVAPGIWATQRFFPCQVCGMRTGYVVHVEPDCMGVHCCSEECLAIWEIDNQPHPVSSAEECHIDTVEVKGPTPLPDIAEAMKALGAK